MGEEQKNHKKCKQKAKIPINFLFKAKAIRFTIKLIELKPYKKKMIYDQFYVCYIDWYKVTLFSVYEFEFHTYLHQLHK